MNKNKRFRLTAAAVAALALAVCMSLPCSAFAFMNPKQNPLDIRQTGPDSAPGATAQPAVPSADSQDRGAKASDKGGSENSAAAVLSPGEISMAAASDGLLKSSGLMDFNRTSGRRWQAIFSAQTGQVKRLYGAESKAYSGTPENAAAEFLKSAHALLGLKGDLSDLRIQGASQSAQQQHVRFQQTLNGVDIQGAQIIVHSDLKGRVAMVQNNSLSSIEPVNHDLIALEAARDIAENDLRAKLGLEATLLEARAKKLLIPIKGQYRYIWKITIPTRTPWAKWVYHLDAQSGAILYPPNEIIHITSGRGRAYLDNAQRWLNKLTRVKLNYLYEDRDGRNQGFLRGLHSSVYDWNYDLAYSYKLDFTSDPASEKVYFDQAQAYYQHTAAWQWWEKNVINKYGPINMTNFSTLSMPVIVNVDEMYDENGELQPFCNAMYDEAVYEDLGLGLLPTIVYGNENTCPWMNEDFVVDTDIVRHEYTHAIMDWAGPGFAEQFGGELDNYGRAMGEGNADWYAFLASGKPSIAYVTFAPDGLRNIDNNRRYPYDVDCPDMLSDNETICHDADLIAEGYQGTPVPQEHYTGEIWGGYLYDLSRVLKNSALSFVYPSSFYFTTDNGTRDGFPDFVDAIRAQRDAELARTGKNNLFLKAFGSMVSRGFIRALPDSDLYSHPCDYFFTRTSGSDERDYLTLEAPLKLKTPANMLVSGDEHEYPFEALEGMLLSAKVSAKKGGLKAPVIALYTSDGVLLTAVDLSANPFITKAAMNYTIPSNGRYVVSVSGMNASPARGHYTFQLTVQ